MFIFLKYLAKILLICFLNMAVLFNLPKGETSCCNAVILSPYFSFLCQFKEIKLLNTYQNKDPYTVYDISFYPIIYDIFTTHSPSSTKIIRD